MVEFLNEPAVVEAQPRSDGPSRPVAFIWRGLRHVVASWGREGAETYDGEGLCEAKIHAFAVRAECRNQGIGTELQKQVIRRARELGCYQVASYSSYGRDANYHVKLSLGFAVQPEVHGDHEQGSYFLMPLRALDLE